MKIIILGTRGIPAEHGGFETFAESLALHLVRLNHEVTVYCQVATPPAQREDKWRGVHRVHIRAGEGPRGTMQFDLEALLDALRRPGLLLILGYNTAVFSVLVRLRRRASLMNMDGLEWKREKWSLAQRLWLRLNEFAGAKLSTHLIADHPEIGRHLEQYVAKSKITVIAYGADAVVADAAGEEAWQRVRSRIGIGDQPYSLVVARLEPENSIEEIVTAFSRRPREHTLVVLGKLTPDTNAYHRRVQQSAGKNVLFPGAIYEKQVVSSLRLHASVYFHGHRVGGTNPSLVEAMAAGNAIVAHDNVFTRWVAGGGAEYFQDADDLAMLLDRLLEDPLALQRLREGSVARHLEEFTQPTILGAYTVLLKRFAAEDQGRVERNQPGVGAVGSTP